MRYYHTPQAVIEEVLGTSESAIYLIELSIENIKPAYHFDTKLEIEKDFWYAEKWGIPDPDGGVDSVWVIFNEVGQCRPATEDEELACSLSEA